MCRLLYLLRQSQNSNTIFSTLIAAIILSSNFQTKAATYIVAQSGGDFTSIQDALDIAVAGDTILVKEKSNPYYEKISFPRSGNSTSGDITLMASPGMNPIIDGTGISGSNMVMIELKSYIRIIGFEIRNNLGVNDGSGIRIVGSGSHIEIQNNSIHDILGQHAMGITVYGTETTAISNLIIDGNEIYDCEPATSEALTLNGNITDFKVTNNIVRDVNNIGIDFIGGETDINPDPTRVARNGVCQWNEVYRANSTYGGGYAAGIYVDGAKDIIIENNIVSQCDLGIEIGAENAGVTASGIVVRNNRVYFNEKVGLVFGGYEAGVGRTENCRFLNNVCYKNDTLHEGLGELWIQFAEDNDIRNNIFYSNAQNVLMYSEEGNINNTLDYNMWFTEDGPTNAEFTWNGTYYDSFTNYQNGSGQDTHSLFSNPQFADADLADFHISFSSPAVDEGDPLFTPGDEVDIDNEPRVSGGRVDIGADEVHIDSVVYNFAAPGWYLISLPLTPSSAQVSELFPNALDGTAYIWSSGENDYEAVEELQTTNGYWLAVPVETTCKVYGFPVRTYTKELTRGWFMIGSVLGGADFTNPNDTPNGAVLTPAFGWNASNFSYDTVSYLTESEGYWVAVLDDCILTIGDGIGNSSPTTTVNWPEFFSEYGPMPPLPPSLDWNEVETYTLPNTFILYPNFPNPFNPETVIEYVLPKSSHTEISVYNVRGEAVRNLVDQEITSGYHSVVWNGRDDQGKLVGSGVYILRMIACTDVHSQKITLLR